MENVRIIKAVQGNSNFVLVSHGYRHSVAITDSGELWSWGKNNFGQLGKNYLSPGDAGYELPSRIGTFIWSKVICGGLYSLALRDNGTLWAWGLNTHGQLGLGDEDTRHRPIQVNSDADWVDIVCGIDHTLAIKTDGTLWAWGFNLYGKTGVGDVNDSVIVNIPTQVGTDDDWSMVSAGFEHTLAIKTDGTMWSWGCNNKGQLGLGKDTAVTVPNPTRIGTDNDWLRVECGPNHSMAIKKDGSLWAWGYNTQGQLGLGDVNTRYTPTPVKSKFKIKWLSVKCSPTNSHVTGVLEDGTIMEWGHHAISHAGAVYDSTDMYSTTPTLIK